MLQTVPALLDYLRATFALDSDVTFDDRFEAIKAAEAPDYQSRAGKEVYRVHAAPIVQR